MILIEIIKYSFSSMIWGVLIAFLSMTLFVLLIKGWYKDATFSPISYIVGAFLFILLSFQCVMIVGSLKIIDMTDEYEKKINTIIEGIYSPSDEITISQSSDIIDTIINEYPILEYYIGGGKFSGYTAKELPHAMAIELQSFMRWYIIRRILWCLGFVIIGAIFVIKSMSRSYARQRIQRTQDRPRIQHYRKRINNRPRR